MAGASSFLEVGPDVIEDLLAADIGFSYVLVFCVRLSVAAGEVAT